MVVELESPALLLIYQQLARSTRGKEKNMIECHHPFVIRFNLRKRMGLEMDRTRPSGVFVQESQADKLYNL